MWILGDFLLVLSLIVTVTGDDEKFAFIDRETLHQVSSHIIKKEQIFATSFVQEETVQKFDTQAEQIRQKYGKLGVELREKIKSAQKINHFRKQVEHIEETVEELRKRFSKN